MADGPSANPSMTLAFRPGQEAQLWLHCQAFDQQSGSCGIDNLFLK